MDNEVVQIPFDKDGSYVKDVSMSNWIFKTTYRKICCNEEALYSPQIFTYYNDSNIHSESICNVYLFIYLFISHTQVQYTSTIHYVDPYKLEASWVTYNIYLQQHII